MPIVAEPISRTVRPKGTSFVGVSLVLRLVLIRVALFAFFSQHNIVRQIFFEMKDFGLERHTFVLVFWDLEFPIVGHD